MMKVIFSVISILVLFACKEKEVEAYSGYHLPEKKMVTLLTDIMLAEGNEKVVQKYGFNTNVLIDSSYQFIYKSQKIEKWQMDSSFKYYSNRPDEFTEIMESVLENINRLEN